MNEQQRGEYNALILQQEVYKNEMLRASKVLSNAIEAHIQNPTIFTEHSKNMAEAYLGGYQELFYSINLRLEAFLKNL